MTQQTKLLKLGLNRRSVLVPRIKEHLEEQAEKRNLDFNPNIVDKIVKFGRDFCKAGGLDFRLAHQLDYHGFTTPSDVLVISFSIQIDKRTELLFTPFENRGCLTIYSAVMEDGDVQIPAFDSVVSRISKSTGWDYQARRNILGEDRRRVRFEKNVPIKDYTPHAESLSHLHWMLCAYNGRV